MRQCSPTDSIRALLQRTSFYIFPNMSPDAMEQYFAPLKYERQGNSAETDDDRDGRRNEDPAEDLDGNGRITVIRVESPIGEYRLNPDDPRSLVKADLTRGEKGSYQVYTEGIDNDKDGLFNEDGEGGVGGAVVAGRHHVARATERRTLRVGLAFAALGGHGRVSLEASVIADDSRCDPSSRSRSAPHQP